MTYDLVLTPVRMAIWDQTRKGHPIEPGTLLHHSDAGAQYTAIAFVEHLEIEGITPSIGTVADAYDNALMESAIGEYKKECIDSQIFHKGPLTSVKDVEYATMAWVHWYNNTRPHTAINYHTPTEIEQDYYLLNTQPQPELEPA